MYLWISRLMKILVQLDSRFYNKRNVYFYLLIIICWLFSIFKPEVIVKFCMFLQIFLKRSVFCLYVLNLNFLFYFWSYSNIIIINSLFLPGLSDLFRMFLLWLFKYMNKCTFKFAEKLLYVTKYLLLWLKNISFI